MRQWPADFALFWRERGQRQGGAIDRPRNKPNHQKKFDRIRHGRALAHFTIKGKGLKP